MSDKPLARLHVSSANEFEKKTGEGKIIEENRSPRDILRQNDNFHASLTIGAHKDRPDVRCVGVSALKRYTAKNHARM